MSSGIESREPLTPPKSPLGERIRSAARYVGDLMHSVGNFVHPDAATQEEAKVTLPASAERAEVYAEACVVGETPPITLTNNEIERAEALVANNPVYQQRRAS